MSLISIIIPTRDRSEALSCTLDALGALPVSIFGGDAPEVRIIDNASATPVSESVSPRLTNGIRVHVERLETNRGAAARNLGADAASGEWLLMLDDDSSPVDGDFGAVLRDAPDDVAAIGGEILLPDGTHEAGGLPEVIVGCGCAIRRDLFLEVGGYDPSFEYYVEEYDLCARFLMMGLRVAQTSAIRFEHRKVASGRDFAGILRRLVRNNAWVLQRYAPDDQLHESMAAMLGRYRAIAIREDVTDAFDGALEAVDATLARQVRRPMNDAAWDRFTGARAVRERVLRPLLECGVDAVQLVRVGKGADVIERELLGAGIAVRSDAEARVIGTLSPGPMLDAMSEDPEAVAAWAEEAIAEGPSTGY